MNDGDVLCLILGGGRGTRLWPLTKSRAKPAVPVGGKYRLIDISLSNCLNSGLHRIAVLTQFNSVSLNRHITQTYHFDHFHSGWVQVLAAEQTSTISDWYQGTADAVRKHLGDILASRAKYVLILAGDHLYRMDYAPVLRSHHARKADITIVVKPIARPDAHRFGILKRTTDGRVTSFVEKPQKDAVLADMLSHDHPGGRLLASMGIYVFSTRTLMDLLDSEFVDFGTHVIPAAIRSYRVYGHSFDGFWEDIGTIRSFYDANLALAQPNPPFVFHDPIRPIYTRPRFLPGCRIHDARLDRVLLGDGCLLKESHICNALIGNRSVIRAGVTMRDTVMLGADDFEPHSRHGDADRPAVGIGRGCHIEGSIIDKNACIGPGVRIAPFAPGTDRDEDAWSVRDGVVIIPKNAVIPGESVLAPSVE